MNNLINRVVTEIDTRGEDFQRTLLIYTPTTTLKCRYRHPHFTDEQIEMQRDQLESGIETRFVWVESLITYTIDSQGPSGGDKISCSSGMPLQDIHFFKLTYLFWERECPRAHATKGGAEREGERENPQQAPHHQCRAQCGAPITHHAIMTGAETRSQTLNQLSYTHTHTHTHTHTYIYIHEVPLKIYFPSRMYLSYPLPHLPSCSNLWYCWGCPGPPVFCKEKVENHRLRACRQWRK